MYHLSQAYIDGAFVPVQGTEVVDIINPATEQVIGTVTLGNRDDVRRAIAAAQRAQSAFGRTTKQERIDMLRRLQAAVLARTDDIREATIDEYGGPLSRSQWVSEYASQCFATAVKTLESYEFTRQVGDATVVMEPVGVAALMTPWNSTAGSICSKLASAVAAGCASVIKPSELSPIQTHVIAQAIHEAGLPPGVVNIVIGRGADVGAEISTNPGIAKISFTGSTPTGKAILRAGAETMKRVSLALTGKSATVILDDADFNDAIPKALSAGFLNNGQACIAGTRILVPRARLAEAVGLVKSTVASLQVGDPRAPTTVIGPLVSQAQYDRIQHFIRAGLEEGATLIAGGEGRPERFTRGYFVKPTVFVDVRNDMEIAREEIFGPVLCLLTYENEDEAVRIANDSAYGLQAYVFSSDVERARRIASRLEAGGVMINALKHELTAPFGGFKQSGLGREYGTAGLEAFLEAKTIVSA
ncbi:aldehyde dehydrogenase family protein [Lysobacter sp. CA199]|uniref:aldehyde dehydrogenase family protein n=1 Tax=Lysobacter sp. CA199 TaxID=3455608 RepID=UPI003F8D5948